MHDKPIHPLASGAVPLDIRTLVGRCPGVLAAPVSPVDSPGATTVGAAARFRRDVQWEGDPAADLLCARSSKLFFT